jgi:hypothetical protein
MAHKRKPNFPLADTFRLLYITLRKKQGVVLAIKFQHRGKTYEADTPDEALKLRNLLESYDGPDATWIPELQDTIENADREPNPWSPDILTELFNEAGDLQRKFLAILTEHNSASDGELTSKALVKKLKLDSELALAGVISGLSKQLKKMSLSPYDVYRVTVAWDGKEKQRVFQSMWTFKLKAHELGWPDAWEEEKKK